MPLRCHKCCVNWNKIFLWRCRPTEALASSVLRFPDHTQRPITFAVTPVDEWASRRRDPYLIINNIHKRLISMPHRYSNPQSQQASGCRLTPKTVRELGPASGTSWGRELWSLCMQGFGKQPSWPFERHTLGICLIKLIKPHKHVCSLGLWSKWTDVVRNLSNAV